MPDAKRSLHTKLAQIMYEAERIPKNGTAPKEMGGYKFVQVGDAADYIRKALAESVITMMPVGVQVVGQADRPTKSGGNMTTVDLITTWRLTDGESGEFIEIQSFGSGADGGDKYSGKASTSAMKYALLTGFLLSTGEDTEGSSLPEQGQRVIQAKEPTHDATTDGGLIGTASVGEAPADYQLRLDPEGDEQISFKLMDGRKGFRVIAKGSLAIELAAVKPLIVGQRVTCWGTMGTDSMVKGGKTINYNVFDLTRIAAPQITLPAEGGSGDVEAGADGSDLGIADPSAPSIPAFTEAELADLEPNAA